MLLKVMEVRGAPLIGATAAYGLALAVQLLKIMIVNHYLKKVSRGFN